MTGCTKCEGTGWIVIEKGGNTAVKKCNCRLVANSNGSRGTSLTEEIASTATSMLCETLAFAPASDLGRVVISNALMKMCHSAEDAFWLVERAANLHTTWKTCGIPGLRQIMSSRCAPKDGLTLSSTEAFPNGIPSEHGVPRTEELCLPSNQAINVDHESKCPALKVEPTSIPDPMPCRVPDTSMKTSATRNKQAGWNPKRETNTPENHPH